MPQLSKPTNVQTQLSADKSTITVSWEDTDPDTKVANFTVRFAPKDGSQPAPPAAATTADGKTRKNDFTPATGSAPTAEELKSNYFAVVVANPASSADTASTPGAQAGLQPYWDISFGVILKMGERLIPLTKPAGSGGGIGGVYRLDVSEANPITLQITDINTLVGTTVVDPTWFKKPPTLSIAELAVDTDNKLFAMDVNASLSLPLFAGLSIDSVTFAVERTDGIHNLNGSASPS